MQAAAIERFNSMDPGLRIGPKIDTNNDTNDKQKLAAKGGGGP